MPFTSEDLVFTYEMVQDRDLEVFRNVAYDSIDRVEASGPRTVVVHWKQSYINADTMFTAALALPLPKHLLDRDYRERGRDILNHPYWSDEFVGTGPYEVRQFMRSSHVLLAASDRYILGRPFIDEIDVRLIPDSNALTANILSGTAELTLGRNVSLEEALQVRENWREGSVAIAPSSWIVIYPQFVNPAPAIVGDVRFRRALLHAMDRQQLVDALQGGASAVAHSFLAHEEPEYRDVEASITRYDYDPRRATQLLEELGYARAADGALRDGAQQRLAIEIRAITGIEINQKAMFSVADYWQQVGVGVESVVVPRARTQDREYVSTFPAFQVNRQGSSVAFLTNRVSSAAPLAENSFVGGNYSRYMDPAFDGLIERFFVTIPRSERMQVLSQIMRQMTDGVQMLGIFYDGTPTLMGKRLANVTARQQGWNAHLWDMR
jgi:peptide/nickel transport system substrate-binding protein